MKLLSPQDWEQLGQEYQNAHPFPSICIDNFLTEEFLAEVMTAYPNYEQAKKGNREFAGLNEYKKVQITQPEKFPEPIKKLSALLASDEFINVMQTLSGIDNLVWDPSFTGGGMHLTNSSGLLDVHVDFNYEKKLDLYRRINILIYLNEEWHDAWGGKIELWDRDVKKLGQSFQPIANRCVIFSTSDYSYHGVTAVTSPEGVSRNSFAAYYYSEEAGDNAGEVYGGHHTTIFKARPTELKKKYFSMPVHKSKQNFKAAKTAIKNMVK
jgi:Rps23 Pro-64 3,4-dihydroxylase Tpa1-like proline 4-hydroxylase